MKPSGFSHRELPVRNGRRADVRLASPGAAGDEAFKKRLTPPFSIDCYGKCNYWVGRFNTLKEAAGARDEFILANSMDAFLSDGTRNKPGESDEKRRT
jgi:hypothetical protein